MYWRYCSLLVLLLIVSCAQPRQLADPESPEEVEQFLIDDTLQGAAIVSPYIWKSCTDEDGNNSDVSGTTIAIFRSQRSSSEQTIKLRDRCLQDGRLAEFTCRQNAPGVSLIRCQDGCKDGACIPAPVAIPPTKSPPSTFRQPLPYGIGIGYSAVNHNYTASQAATAIKDGAHVIYIQRRWNPEHNREWPTHTDETFSEAVRDVVAEARKNGLGIYLAFEPLSPDRKTLDLPKELKGDFTTPAIQEAYLATVVQAAKEYQPEYFILNVEVNMYEAYDPKSYAAYKELYKKAYAEVKRVSPNTKVAVSHGLIDEDNNNCIDEPDMRNLGSDARGFPDDDLFAVSIYPLCYFDPKLIPENFLDQIAGLSPKPLFISETGWVSDSFQLTPTYRFSADQGAQAMYISRLQVAANYAAAQKKNLSIINYVSIIDPPEDVCQAIIAIDPMFNWYCSLSLKTYDNTPKSGYTTMKNWKSASK